MTYFTVLETKPEVILKELAMRLLEGKPSLAACSDELERKIDVESVASASMLREEVEKMLSDTCRMGKRAVHDTLLQPLRYHRLLSRG